MHYLNKKWHESRTRILEEELSICRDVEITCGEGGKQGTSGH